MSIISFDIGIKNMAYCVFDATGGVVDWNVVSLMNQEPEVRLCSAATKTKAKKNTDADATGSVCGNKAKYEINKECYCVKHAKTCFYLLPDSKCSPASIKKLKLDELKQLAGSRFITVLDSDNKTSLVKKINTFFFERTLQPIVAKKSNAGMTDLVTIGKNMKTEFDKIEHFRTAKHVIVENQISPIATRMKTIQGMLAQYFIMRHDTINIEFLSSAGKLKGFEKQNENIESEYTQHKKDAVFYCRQFLETERYAGWKHILETKKKDDLADCFLQGIHWMKRENIISSA
jgi:hypothetical protein